MSTVKELHNKAMLLLQDAIVLRHNGDDSTANEKYKEAFVLESKAADLVSQKPQCEPSRSILFRSAASLAYQAGDYDNSLRLIGKCLIGNPPLKIKDEIRTLYENIHFKMYLNQQQMVLTDEEFDFHLVGNLISNGLIFYKEFIDRIESLMQIIKRTTQRLFDKPYGSRSDIFLPVLYPVKAGSFSITIRIAYKEGQQEYIFVNPASVVDELMDCFNYIQNGREHELFLKINNESYYNHFVSNSKKIAPDGKEVTGVDFISKRNEVKLIRLSDDIPLRHKEEVDDKNDDKNTNKFEVIKISGVLDLASSKQGKDEFAEITEHDGKTYKIMIGDGLDDYVRSYYKTKVIVDGKFDGNKTIYMDNMEKIDER